MSIYTKMVAALAKPGALIAQEMTAEKAHLWHMGTGVAEEGAEVLGEIKKHVIYGKELDRQKLIKELGDVEFYLEGVRQGIEVTREEVLQANMAKLSDRYHSGSYSDTQAKSRADMEQQP
jgi:NTP pyrophosphatase (non-canonical NTP hydrolase)